MRTYEKYIDSGIDWVGLVPSNWRQTQLKYISSISKGRKAKEDFQDFKEGMIPYLSMEYLRSQTESPSYVFADDLNIVLVEEQDLLILWDGSKAGEIVKAKQGALSSTMGKIHVESDLFDLNYLTYYLKNAERYIQANTVGMGIPHVSGEVLRTLYIIYPKKEEQTQIAQYLDHQTAIIDQLILQKEKLIELLKEKRQAVINEAVTKGLNTIVKMKESGIEWLGEVPEEWQVIKLKFLIDQLESGVSVNSENVPIEIDSSERGVLKTSCVFNYSFIPEENKKVVQEEFDRVQCPVRGNSIIISRMNTPELVGASGYVDKDYPNLYLPDRLWQTVFNDNVELDVEFLSFVLKSEAYRNIYGIIATGTSPSMKNISQNSFLDLPVALPDVKTQNDIKIYLREFDIKTSISLNALEDSIGKLNEYRQSIISEAVTGKIDVRDWQPNKRQIA